MPEGKTASVTPVRGLAKLLCLCLISLTPQTKTLQYKRVECQPHDRHCVGQEEHGADQDRLWSIRCYPWWRENRFPQECDKVLGNFSVHTLKEASRKEVETDSVSKGGAIVSTSWSDQVKVLPSPTLINNKCLIGHFPRSSTIYPVSYAFSLFLKAT